MAAALLTQGLWPWILLAVLLCYFAWPKFAAPSRRGHLLLIALALHEVMVAACGTLAGDAVLTIDAAIARELSSFFFSDVRGSGTALQIGTGHLIALVWGCSSLSYLGDMLLLFWAIAILLYDGRGTMPRNVWGWITIVAAVTVLMNTVRIGLMAVDQSSYTLFHHGDGAVWFRIANLGVAIGAAWIWSRHENLRIARRR